MKHGFVYVVCVVACSSPVLILNVVGGYTICINVCVVASSCPVLFLNGLFIDVLFAYG